MHRTTAFTATLAIAAVLMTAAPAEAQLRVRYTPELGFTDASDQVRPGLSFRGTLTELTRTFAFLGQLYLPAGERLDVTVLSLRAAGIQPRGAGDVGAPSLVTSATHRRSGSPTSCAAGRG